MKEEVTGNPFKVIIIAVGVLFALSFVPWGKLTGNYLKDFNLLADVMPGASRESGGGELVDPDLELALAEMPDQPAAASSAPVADSVEAPVANQVESRPVPEVAPRVGDKVVIEDYTPDRRGLARFSSALQSDGFVRIAMIGDSYIEGDVFSQNIRENLQETYGGGGAGFLALHSDIPGFRQSVRQTDSGFTLHDLRKDKSTNGRWLGGVFAIGAPGAKATFKGVDRLPHANGWNRARLLFIAPESGVITIDFGSGAVEYPVEASTEVQAIEVSGDMTSVKIENRSVPSLVALGLWLENSSGVGLDCMSLRGNSGVALRKLNSDLVASMRRHIDYNLIIIEYGLNAISSDQSDYSAYGKLMEQVITGIRQLYPDADILIMGVGDRGQKAGSEVHSLTTVQNMVNEQRSLARRLGVLFWDTREAMGGADAVVSWRANGWINADYIHLNHKGGAELGARFADAIKNAVSN